MSTEQKHGKPGRILYLIAIVIGWSIGALAAMFSGLWRHAKGAVIGAVLGWVIGSATGIAIAGTAFNGAFVFAAFGALLGGFGTSAILRRIKR